jgi:hypothetical protein
MFHVTPGGVLVIEIIWDGEYHYFPADLNEPGDLLCHVETETMWRLNWTIDTRKMG